ncbi:MAG: cytochrome b561/polyisoprenoid-binding protein YceI [Cellvibrionaceae bacterium]|jgi:cytochrome b561/polyisoprenoid-binding protein YceI
MQQRSIFKNHFFRWGLVSQGFHWLIALLIFLAIALGLIAEEVENSPLKIKLFVLHKSMGISVLALVICRLLWRWGNPIPRAAKGIGITNQRLAEAGHRLLYVLMFALPLSGWVVNSAANFPFRWFNTFSIPDLPWIPAAWQAAAASVHWWLFVALGLLLAIHIVMAIVHHRLHRSDVMLRMLPNKSPRRFFSIFLSALLFIFAASFYWARTPSTAVNVANSAAIRTELELVEKAPIAHTDRQWRTSDGPRRLAFTGRYSDEPFKGEFRRFEADLFFDPQAIDAGFFRVKVDTSSVTAYSDDFDSALATPEWFYVKRYPQAIYQASDFQRFEDGFVANGTLTIKGFQTSVPLRFRWVENESGQVDFSANAVVDRRTFGLGLGEWANDPTISFEVNVQFDLRLVEMDKRQ